MTREGWLTTYFSGALRLTDTEQCKLWTSYGNTKESLSYIPLTFVWDEPPYARFQVTVPLLPMHLRAMRWVPPALYECASVWSHYSVYQIRISSVLLSQAFKMSSDRSFILCVSRVWTSRRAHSIEAGVELTVSRSVTTSVPCLRMVVEVAPPCLRLVYNR